MLLETKSHGVFSHRTLSERSKRGQRQTFLFLGSYEECLRFIAKASKANRRILDDLDIVEFKSATIFKPVKWRVKELPIV